MNKEVWIDYTNHRGERRTRRIRPHYIMYAANKWHPNVQWLLEAEDRETGESRTFALANIHSWTPPVQPMEGARDAKA